jgi:hypothetical protein
LPDILHFVSDDQAILHFVSDDQAILRFASDDEARKSLLTPTQEKNDRLCDATIYLANSMAEANLYKLTRKGAILHFVSDDEARGFFSRGFKSMMT